MKPKRIAMLRCLVAAFALILLSNSVTHSQTTNPCPPSIPGIVGWWRAEGSALDDAGNGHGTLENGTNFAAGKVGQAFSLDGVDDYVAMPGNTNYGITTALSIEAWIRWDSVQPRGVVLSKYSVNYNTSWAFAVTPNGSLRFGVSGDNRTDRYVDTTNGAVAPNTWVHVAATFDAFTQMLSVYVNGDETTTTLDPISTTIPFIHNSSSPVRVGAIEDGTAQLTWFFKGAIDEVRLYNRALAPSEVRLAYLGGSTLLDTVGPFGRNGGYLNNPITNLVISLKQPLDSNAFNATNIVVDGPMGRARGIRITELCDRTYQIDFPALTLDGAYLFTLSPTLLGTNGLPLDINLNGTPGEANDIVTFTLILDTVGPRITQQSPSGGVLGPLSGVDVTFNEAIDAASFTAADAFVIDPTGHTNQASNVWRLGTNRFHVEFSSLTNAGAYVLVIGPNVQDLAGNSLQRDADGVPGDSGNAYRACIYLHAGDASGLVSWWPANGNTYDYADDNHGILRNGATFASGSEGAGFKLNGVRAYVEIPDTPSVSLTNSISVSARISPEAVSGIYTIAAKYDSASASWYFGLQPGGKLRFGVYGNGSDLVLDTASAVVQTGVLTHAVGTFDLNSQTLKIYVNAIEVPTIIAEKIGVVSSILDGTSPIGVGGGYNASFIGIIDDLRIYNHALSSAEIQFDYARSHSLLDAVSPFGRNAGYFTNGPITNLVLSFRQPLAVGEYNRTNILITGQQGMFFPQSFTEICDRTYEVSFPPLAENSSYHFTFSSRVLNAGGLLWDFNLNGTNGEPGDAFTFTLAIDTIRPRIVTRAPAGDVAGTITNVDIWFSEPMDKATLVPFNAVLTNSLGQTIAIDSVREVGLNRHRFSFAPQTAPALYSLRLGTNVTDLAGNRMILDFDPLTFNLVPVDLALDNVTTSTNALLVGESVTVAWTGRNNSGAPLLGSWTDVVYLSHDARWDITDVRLGTMPHTGGLGSNEIYSASSTFYVPGLLPGNYYLLVRADIANVERELNETNNLVAYGPLPLTIRTLSVGGDGVNGVFTAGNRLHYFAIQVAAGESLRLRFDGQGGVNHLFVNHASIPTRLNSDFSGTAASAGQLITLSGVPGGGIYYVLVSGEQIGGSGSYTLRAETAPFFVTVITPTALVGGESARFWVPALETNLPSAVVNGEGFDQETTVQFVRSSGTTLTPTRVEFVSPTKLNVFLPTTSWPADTYSVRVTKGTAARTLTNIFTLAGSGEAKLEARFFGTGLSPGGGQTLYIDYVNSGSRPMPAPLLKITAYTNAVIVTHKLNRRPQASLNPPVGIYQTTGGGGGRAVGWVPAYRFRVGVPLFTAQAMAIGSGATPGILQPGERGSIPIHFEGLLQDRFETSVQFSVGSLTADDTTIQDCGSPAPGVPTEYRFPRHGQRRVGPGMNATNVCPEYLFSPDWRLLEEQSVPETVDFEGWRAVWANITNRAGPLWADYVMMLGDNMNHLAKVGQLTNDPSALFNFEVLQASAALSPVRTLSGAVDASVPSSGFPLVFRRVYGQPILSRYKRGPLGRGWSHNWDISVQGLEKFSGAVVHGPGGADRFFGRYNDGSYTPTGIDTGRLILTNNLFRLIEADGTVWNFGGPANKLGYVEDPNGNRITCGYTGSQLTSLTHTSGKQLLLQYNGSGRLAQITDPVGPGASDDRVTTYEYDGSGEHLIRVTAPGNRVTTYAYHTTGIPQRLHALTNVTHPDLTQDSFAYDAQGRLIQTSQNCCGGAQQVTYAYDSAGTVIVTDATGRATQLLYGLGGQLAQVRDGEGRIVNFTYDDLAQLTQLLGPGGERYRYGYDGLGNLSGIEDPLRQNNNFTYEPNFNRLAQVRDARGNGLQYAYDNRGNLTAITYADNTRELFAYDARGNVITTTNRRGGVITYAYNPAGQLTNKNYAATPGITDFTYAYDSAGNLTNAAYWNPQLATQESFNLQYDPFTDRLTRIEYPGGRFFTFDYDPAGRRTRRADQDGHVTAYLYDALGRLARMTNELGQIIVNYDYDPAGRLSRKTLGNGVFTTYTYNAAGQVVELINQKADRQVLSSFAYTYDASGRRASMTTLAGTETYGYDSLGQLTRVTYPNSRVVTYAYDAAGNRTQVTDNGVPTPYTANTLNQYTLVGATNYACDLDGNLVAEMTTDNGLLTTNKLYTYDSENRLIAVTTPADTWTYTYDAFGNRIAAAHNGQTTRYVIDPTGLGNVAAEYDGGGSLIARYEHGFGLLARNDAAGNSAFYTFSAIGHTSELTDPAGAVANAYAYDPFGLSLAKTETIPNPFEFVGEFGVMNEGNGLEFMRARYQIPTVGRFSSEDPLQMWGGSLNFYEYAGNSPTTLSDPSGLAVFGPGWGKWILVGNIILGAPDFGKGGSLPDPPPIIITKPAPGDTGDKKGGEGDGDGDGDGGDDDLGGHAFVGGNTGNQGGFGFPDGGTAPGPVPGPVPAPEPSPTHPEDDDSSPVVRSRDPNDKLGPSGYGSAAYLPADGTLAYQIRFENQPSATAPAQRVTVTDTLDPNLDLSTFELTEIAFANQVLAVPAGLNHYETRISLIVTNGTLLPGPDLNSIRDNSCNSCLVVEVDARLDLATRLLTLTLTTLDPLTGWTPENPLLGFLYPNDTNHVGEGSISYLVRGQTNLTTGATITNRADIVFDYNDPIITPLVSNTIDSAPPTSSVAPLPAEADPAILVQWSGQDDAGGSGLASYDVYVTTVTNVGQASSLSLGDGTGKMPVLPWARWLERTTATSALFRGEPGSTYAFYSVARDNVGQEESTPATPDTIVFVPTNAPVLSDLTNRVADVGSVLLITNTVSGTPVGSFVFSLGAPAPFGASINPTNGVLRWTPNCTQASRTHTLTVLVTDTGNPNLRDLRTFTVTTRECVVPELGRFVLLAGDSGRVPVNLISTVPLTNLSITVETDTNRLVNLWLEPIVPEICAITLTPALSHPMGEGGEGGGAATPHPDPLLDRGGEGEATGSTGASPVHRGALAAMPPQHSDAGGGAPPAAAEAAAVPNPVGTGFHTLSFTTCPNQSLIGTQQIAWLHFTAVSNQSSAFVSLKLDNAVGQQPDGTEVRNFAPQAGRVAVVGEEPLLEATHATNGQVQLTLYSKTGVTNRVQSTISLPVVGPWTEWQQIVLSNILQNLTPLPPTNRVMIFRVVR